MLQLKMSVLQMIRDNYVLYTCVYEDKTRVNIISTIITLALDWYSV
jgi:hypothetical protein